MARALSSSLSRYSGRILVALRVHVDDIALRFLQSELIDACSQLPFVITCWFSLDKRLRCWCRLINSLLETKEHSELSLDLSIAVVISLGTSHFYLSVSNSSARGYKIFSPIVYIWKLLCSLAQGERHSQMCRLALPGLFPFSKNFGGLKLEYVCKETI